MTADQQPDEWVALTQRAVHRGICTCGLEDACQRWNLEGISRKVFAAVWPLVQAMIRDAKVETLDEVATRFGDVKYPDVWSVLSELRREVQS